MTSLRIRVNDTQFASVQKLLRAYPRGAEKAINRGVNKTAVTIRSRVVRGIAGKIALKQKDIRARTKLLRARRGRRGATIILRARRISIMKFGARATKRKGVTYRIKKSGGRQRIRTAWIAMDRGGKPRVFRRGPKGGPEAAPGSPRLPIFAPTGPSVAQVYEDQLSGRTFDGDMANLLQKNVDKQVRLLLDGITK